MAAITNGLITDVKEFRAEYHKLTLAAFATIFTWGFVQGLKRTVLTPVIAAYLIPSQAEDKALNVPLRKNQTLQLAEFLAELIQFAIFMLLIFAVWRISKATGLHPPKN